MSDRHSRFERAFAWFVGTIAAIFFIASLWSGAYDTTAQPATEIKP